jgi:hypothetical protein
MKNIINRMSFRACRGISLIVLIGLLFSTTGCDDDNDCQGIDCLPPATQTGEGTFGCLVNGEPFVDNSGFFNCFYQLVDGEYFFGIRGRDEVGEVDQIVLSSWMKEIELNINIALEERAYGNFFTELSFDCICPNALSTNQEDGFIRFTEFNTNQNIVSGTFEFDILNPDDGQVYQITDGRFDSFYAQ